MNKWSLFFCLAMCMATVLGEDKSAGLININSTMELGQPGPGVPGYRLVVNRILREAVSAAPDKLYMPQTVNGGNPGHCMAIPGYKGLCGYQVELADFYIRQDGEVEIAFDAKIGPDVDGKIHAGSRYHIDFRCMPNQNAGEKYYPMLTSFGFKPDGQWRHFAKRFKVTKRDNFYNIWIMGNAVAGEKGLNSLYVDNFSVRLLGLNTGLPDEVAVMPDRVDSIYRQGEPVKMFVRALLNRNGNEAKVTLDVITDYNNQVIENYAVAMKKKESAGGNDRRNIYEGTLTLPPNRFGAFSMTASCDGAKLKTVGGDFTVIHPVVAHPRFSPGWKIGYNQNRLCPSGRTGSDLDYTDYFILYNGGFERGFRIATLAGLKLARFWGDWIMVEPEKNKFRKDLVQPAMDMFKKYDIDPIYILAGDGLNLHGNKEQMQKMLSKGQNTLPRYLYSYYHQGKVEGSILPPLEDYDRFLNFVLNSWGNQVWIWELFNEPGLGALPADRYLEYLRDTYQTVKKRFPHSLVLGNGVTGDFGMNVIKWCEELNAVDPDYEKYLDGIAFHPYGGALDYENGHYFLHSKAIADIRSKLKVKKPLWNTECFYLTDARKPQMKWYINLEHCGAGEEQRHILESMMNGVVGVTAMIENTLYKRSAPVTVSAPTQVFAATNALSFLLKDMDKLSVLELNRFIKAGIFTSASGDRALGFVYDLRPSGSDWTLPGNLHGVAVVDLFGNPMTGKKCHLTYEPYYLQGTPEAVRRVLKESKIISRNGVLLTGRRFRDQVYLEGRSNTGSSGLLEVRLADASLPESVSLYWPTGSDYSTVSEFQTAPGKSLTPSMPWQGIIAGETVGNGVLAMVPDTGCYDIPYDAQAPLELKLNGGDLAWIWGDNQYLQIKVKVRDDELIAAKGRDLWNGDALEVFIDTNPFARLDRKAVMVGKDSLNVYQYGFAAMPSASGATTIAFSKKRGEIKTAALNRTEKTADGYLLTASIPWTEIIPDGGVGDVFGIDLEIDQVSKSGMKKESLGNNPGNCYRERLHYPLFRLPVEVYRRYLERSVVAIGGGMVSNGDFSRQQYGDPEEWGSRIQGRTQIKAGKEYGLNRSGLLIEVPVGQLNSTPAAVTQTLPLQPGKCRKIVVRVLARLDRVEAHGLDKKQGGMLLDLNFYDGVAKKFIAHAEYGAMIKAAITGSTGWKEYQLVADIPAKASAVTLSVGLKNKTSGRMMIDDVSVVYY